MANRVTVVGVHPVDLSRTDGPIHLVEIAVEGDLRDFYFMDITQDVPRRPQKDWPVAWAEHLFVEATGHWESIWPTRDAYAAAGRARFAFFFHHLDLTRPLRTSFGPVRLPPETPVPAHLAGVEYEVP
jgi:hypothetical protein